MGIPKFENKIILPPIKLNEAQKLSDELGQCLIQIHNAKVMLNSLILEVKQLREKDV